MSAALVWKRAGRRGAAHLWIRDLPAQDAAVCTFPNTGSVPVTHEDVTEFTPPGQPFGHVCAVCGHVALKCPKWIALPSDERPRGAA